MKAEEKNSTPYLCFSTASLDGGATMKTALLMLMAVAACLGSNSYAAEYMGSNIDGESYNCTAFSYSTSQYYYLTCEFSGDEVILYFPKGGHITISMDSEEIDDPSSISAFDYNKSAYWDLDVDM